jgi:hypothetical protein
MKINPTDFSLWPLVQLRRRKFQSNAVCWVFQLMAGMALLTASAGAQEVPRLQFFGGYSYTRFDSSTFGFSSGTNLNGWNAAISGNLIRGLGATAELTGQYGYHMNLRDFAVGPQFLFPHGRMLYFAHLLVGKGRTFVNEGGGVGDTQRAYLLGGGVDMPFRRRFDIRLVQADYVRTELLGQTQDNFRVSVGLVYRWGEVKRTKHRAPTTQRP